MQMEYSPEINGLECELGTIKAIEWICPGVFLLSVQNEDELFSRDYYVITKESTISQKAKAYGQKASDLWLFLLDDDHEEYKIIQYEIAKYRTQNNLPLDEPLRATAFFAAQSFPEYFGNFPVPLNTPSGCTVRHWILDNGIYWIETDQCEKFLAVCYPVWSSELSDLIIEFGEGAETDKRSEVEKNMGYIFFPMEISCIPIYELTKSRPVWTKTIIDKAALMNAIWKIAPEYVYMVNKREQSGQNDGIAAMLTELGANVTPHIAQDYIITFSPDVGENFFGKETSLNKDVNVKEYQSYGLPVRTVHVKTEQAAAMLHKKFTGHYTTISAPLRDDECLQNICCCLAEQLDFYLSPYKGETICICGIGNSSIPVDALGPEVVKGILPRMWEAIPVQSKFKKIAAFCPGVSALTNIENDTMISSIASAIGAACIVTIDVTRTSDYYGLCSTIDITDTGMESHYDGKCLNFSTIGVPVISIGIPTFFHIGQLLPESCSVNDPYLTASEINHVIKNSAFVIAHAILRVAYPELDYEDSKSIMDELLS